jgi:hypothetical protein
MELSDRSKILILFAVFALVVYVIYTSNNDNATPNEGSLTQNLKTEDNESQNVQVVEETVDVDNADDGSRRYNSKYLAKFRGRNTAPCGQFRYSSYADGSRGGRASDLDKFFEGNHPLDEQTGFVPSNEDNNDGTGDQHARYIPGKRRKLRDVDKFNVDEMLPREKNADWFDDPYEATTVKNSHLINIYKPVGVNTQGNSLKNASWDLRGDTYTAPKFVVGPWMNSTIEPDTNIRTGALC